MWCRPAVLVACVSMLFLESCRTDPVRSRVVIIPRRTVDTQWASLRLGLTDGGKIAGLTPYWNGPSIDTDVESQIDLANEAIQGGASGIVAEPNSRFSINGALQQALSEGIPVVVLNAPIGLPASKHLSYVLSDELTAGTLVADRLASLLDHRGEVILSGLRVEVPGNIDRSDQIIEALHQNAPEIQVVEKIDSGLDPAVTRQELETAIRKHPKVGAIVALSQNEAQNALAAVYRTGNDGKIKVIACGQSAGLFRQLHKGAVDSLLVDDMRGMGMAAMFDIDADRKGRPYPTVISLKPVLVTLDNINTEDIQQRLLMNRVER